MFTRPRAIQDTLVCNGIRRIPLVPTTRTKMQLLLGVFAKDALSVVHINTRPTSIMLCPTHLMRQVSNSSLTHSCITSVGHSGYVYAHLFTELASRQVYPVFTKSKLVTELTTNMSELFYAHPDWKPNGSLIARSKWIWKQGINQQNLENSAILLVIE